MRDGQHDRVHFPNVGQVDELDAVQRPRFVGVGGRVGDDRLDPVFAQLFNDVENLRVPRRFISVFSYKTQS